MEKFIYKEPYLEEGKTILEVNLFPGKYCNFNCIFCPVSRKLVHVQTQESVDLGNLDFAIQDLRQRIQRIMPEMVFLNSLGESVLLKGVEQVIDAVHREQVPIRLLSNGYLYGTPAYAALAGRCEEVIGELKMGREEALRTENGTGRSFPESPKTYRRLYSPAASPKHDQLQEILYGPFPSGNHGG